MPHAFRAASRYQRENRAGGAWIVADQISRGPKPQWQRHANAAVLIGQGDWSRSRGMGLHTERDKSQARSAEIWASPAVVASQSKLTWTSASISYSMKRAKTRRLSSALVHPGASRAWRIFKSFQLARQLPQHRLNMRAISQVG